MAEENTEVKLTIESSDKLAYPKGFFCPLTGAVMEDPVITPDAKTYEKTAIEREIKKRKDKTPSISKSLKVTDLIPNRTLKAAIIEFKATQGSFASEYYMGKAEEGITVLEAFKTVLIGHLHDLEKGLTPETSYSLDEIYIYLFGPFCPSTLTLQIFEDPIISDGIAYERKAIQNKLQETQAADPLTHKPLIEKQLIENLALKDSIAELKDKIKVDLIGNGAFHENFKRIMALIARINAIYNRISRIKENRQEIRISNIISAVVAIVAIYVGMRKCNEFQAGEQRGAIDPSLACMAMFERSHQLSEILFNLKNYGKSPAEVEQATNRVVFK